MKTIIVGSSGRSKAEMVINETEDYKSVMICGSGNLFEEESFELTRVESKSIFESPNGMYWSNFAPIDNKGNIIKPKGSKYHK